MAIEATIPAEKLAYLVELERVTLAWAQRLECPLREGEDWGDRAMEIRGYARDVYAVLLEGGNDLGTYPQRQADLIDQLRQEVAELETQLQAAVAVIEAEAAAA